MTTNIKITKDDIVNEVKLSGSLPDIIDRIIDRKIIGAAVAKLKISATDAELQVSADQFRLMRNLQTSQATMMWLQENSLTVQDLETIAESNVHADKLIDKLLAQEDVERYFFENKLNYIGVVIYEVVLASPDLAMELFYAIKEGEMTFQQVARQHCTEPELQRTGGYMGFRRRSELLPEISAAVFAEQSARLLKPVKTSQGNHLIYVEQIVEPLLADVSGEIKMTMFGQWLQRYKDEIDVVKVL